MTEKLRAYLALHFCVLVWGFTAILGKFIQLNAISLVWWRVLLCWTALIWMIPRSEWRAMKRPKVLRLLGIGMMVGVHWMCFYGAVKLSNASVAVATMATTALFAAFTEPFILRQPFKWYELLLGILILPGIVLMVGDLDWNMRWGFLVGTAGAFLAAVFSTLNKREITMEPTHPFTMSGLELFGGWVITSLVLLVLQPGWDSLTPVGDDWAFLLLLAYVCTLLPYNLSLVAMRHISAFATNLTINLEPVYGVLLAIFFFREDKGLSPGFYAGVVLILVAVFSHPFIKSRFEKKNHCVAPCLEQD